MPLCVVDAMIVRNLSSVCLRFRFRCCSWPAAEPKRDNHSFGRHSLIHRIGFRLRSLRQLEFKFRVARYSESPFWANQLLSARELLRIAFGGQRLLIVKVNLDDGLLFFFNPGSSAWRLFGIKSKPDDLFDHLRFRSRWFSGQKRCSPAFASVPINASNHFNWSALSASWPYVNEQTGNFLGFERTILAHYLTLFHPGDPFLELSRVCEFQRRKVLGEVFTCFYFCFLAKQPFQLLT